MQGFSYAWAVLWGYWCMLLVTVVAGFAAGLLISRAQSPHLWIVATYAVVNWLAGVGYWAIRVDVWWFQGNWDPSRRLTFIVWVGWSLYDATLFMLTWVVLDRLHALSVSLWRPLGLHVLKWVVFSLWAMLFIESAPFGITMFDNMTAKPAWGMAKLLLTAVFASWAFIALRAPLRDIHVGAAHLEDMARTKVAWVVRTSNLQSLGLMASVLSLWLRLVVSQTDLRLADQILTVLDVLGQALGAVLLSGVWLEPSMELQTSSTQRMARRRKVMEQRRRQTLASQDCEQPSCDDERWQAKVEELAGRAVTLEALLEFYGSLKEVMPHFQPDLHTTHDVVRQAVIPLSRNSTCALATIMMKGAYTRPKIMVTHTWGNLFRDLVAAIVADALKESDFGASAYLLDGCFDGVVKELRRTRKMHSTYWICAFSVSQHSTICAANLPCSVDPYTCRPHPECPCGAPKYLNTHPPVRWDGKSIPCEVNKFADMMAYLAATDSEFRHVVAVDAKLDLFSRAWCVAEIAEAHRLGMEQELKLRGAEALEVHRELLVNLRVEEMRATRPEDVAEILATIPDKGAFNQHLQGLIFDEGSGLLAHWGSLDCAQQLHRIGRLARLMRMSKGSVASNIVGSASHRHTGAIGV